jgi:hypothetical protein
LEKYVFFLLLLLLLVVVQATNCWVYTYQKGKSLFVFNPNECFPLGECELFLLIIIIII